MMRPALERRALLGAPLDSVRSIHRRTISLPIEPDAKQLLSAILHV